jgi:hypothetical protein
MQRTLECLGTGSAHWQSLTGAHLVLLAEGLDPTPLRKLSDACSHAGVWDPMTGAGTRGNSWVPFRSRPALKAGNAYDVGVNSLDVIDDPYLLRLAMRFPEIAAALPGAIEQLNMLHTFLGIRELAAVGLSKLAPGGYIEPHVDIGLYAAYFARFHFVVCSSPDAFAWVADERVSTRSGQLWFLSHNVSHSVENRSPTDERVHFIMDGTVPGFCGQTRGPLASGAALDPYLSTARKFLENGLPEGARLCMQPEHLT